MLRISVIVLDSDHGRRTDVTDAAGRAEQWLRHTLQDLALWREAGDVLLFLRAHSRLPANAPTLVGHGLRDSGHSWGRFDFALTGRRDDARNIDIPLIFVYQRSDSLMTLQSGIDLFDAFGSSDKAMHINPGGHVAIPVSEREKWKPFFVSHLGKAKVQAD